jgi:hypothetical protein
MLAVMYTWTTYGTWLRGDDRGWVDRGITWPANPQLNLQDRKRLKYEPWLFEESQLLVVGRMIGRSLISRLSLSIYALTVQSWHVHVLTSAPDENWSKTVKCGKDAVRWGLRPGRPIWTDGFDKRFCIDEQTVHNRIEYINRHNVANGWNECPWDFITLTDWFVSPR